MASIDIAVAHLLPQDVAFKRVLAWLQAQSSSQAAFVTVKQTNINNVAHTINLVLDVYGYALDVMITVGVISVTIKSNQATDFKESVAMWVQSMRLQKQLALVLK